VLSAGANRFQNARLGLIGQLVPARDHFCQVSISILGHRDEAANRLQLVYSDDPQKTTFRPSLSQFEGCLRAKNTQAKTEVIVKRGLST
jgi:hypothetical protein